MELARLDAKDGEAKRLTEHELRGKHCATKATCGGKEGTQVRQTTHIEVKMTAPDQDTERTTLPRKELPVGKKPAKEEEMNPCRNGQARSEFEDPEDGDGTHTMNHKNNQTTSTLSKNMASEAERDVRRGILTANDGKRNNKKWL